MPCFLSNGKGGEGVNFCGLRKDIMKKGANCVRPRTILSIYRCYFTAMNVSHRLSVVCLGEGCRYLRLKFMGCYAAELELSFVLFSPAEDL